MIGSLKEWHKESKDETSDISYLLCSKANEQFFCAR